MSEVTRAIQNPERLAALQKVELLDTPPEEAFDQLARLAARLLDAPIALVNLIDSDRQFFKSCIGPLPDTWLSQRQSPLSYSICQHTITLKEPLLVRDAHEHPELRDNLAVRDLGVVSYAGIPLITSEGAAIGTLCVVDSKPREWSAEQVETLRSLAASLLSTIVYRAEARVQRSNPQQDGAHAPTGGDLAGLLEAGDALAKAVSQYLKSLDEYDRCLQGPDNASRTFECQAAVLEAEHQLKQVTDAFQNHWDAFGRAPDDPGLQAAVDLWQSCKVYFDAEKRRTEVTTRFQELRTALAEVEQEVVLVSRAEQAIRMASRTFALKRG